MRPTCNAKLPHTQSRRKKCAGPKTNDSTTHTKTGGDTARAPKATTTYAYIQFALAATPYPTYTVTQAESALAPVNT